MLIKISIAVFALILVPAWIGNAHAGSSFSLNISSRISIEEISKCKTANCLIDLARQEVSKSESDFEKKVANEFIVSSLLRSGDDAQALELLNDMKLWSYKAGYLGSFRYFTNVENDRFDTDDQFWEDVEVDMPSILVGQNEVYDTLYAGWLVYKKQYKKAIELANSFKAASFRRYVYYLMAPALYKDGRLADAKAATSHLPETIDNSILIQQIFKKGKELNVLDTFPEITSDFDLDNAKAGFAILLAVDGKFDIGVSEIENIGNRKIRIAAYTNLLAELASRNKFRSIEQLVTSGMSGLANIISYRKAVVEMLHRGKIDNADRLVEIIASPKKKMQVLSVIGAFTGDYKYFLRIFEDYGKEYRQPGNMGMIAIDMMLGGYLKEAVKSLNIIDDDRERWKARHELYRRTSHSSKRPKDYVKLIEIFEDEILTDKAYLNEITLKYAADLMLVNRTATREPLERFQVMANRIEDQKDREEAQALVIPHYAYIGDFQEAYRIISEIDHTYLRVRALTRLADFYTYGKMVKSN